MVGIFPMCRRLRGSSPRLACSRPREGDECVDRLCPVRFPPCILANKRQRPSHWSTHSIAQLPRTGETRESGVNRYCLLCTVHGTVLVLVLDCAVGHRACATAALPPGMVLGPVGAQPARRKMCRLWRRSYGMYKVAMVHNGIIHFTYRPW